MGLGGYIPQLSHLSGRWLRHGPPLPEVPTGESLAVPSGGLLPAETPTSFLSPYLPLPVHSVFSWGHLYTILKSWNQVLLLGTSVQKGASLMAQPITKTACNARDTGEVSWLPGLGRSSWGGNDNPLQYSYLKNFMKRGVWWARVHTVAKNETWLSN